MIELNMMYHAWTFPHVPFTASAEHKTLVSMAIFDAHGVAPTHQTLEQSVAGKMTPHNTLTTGTLMRYGC